MPLGRLGEPQEIGKAVVFLAAEASSFVMGLNCLWMGDGAGVSHAHVTKGACTANKAMRAAF